VVVMVSVVVDDYSSKRLNTMVSYMVAMVTTIQVSEKLVKELKNRKMCEKESYEDVIWDLIEDTLELSEQTKKLIKQAEKEFEQGKVHSIEEVEKELNL